MMQIFPYMEDASLVSIMEEVMLHEEDRLYANLTDIERAAIRTPVPTMICPSRRAAIAYPIVDFPGQLAGDRALKRFGKLGARTDYAMNGGSLHGRAPQNRIDGNDVMNNDGIWAIGKRAKFKDITDGTSTTYLVGEKYMDPRDYVNGRGMMDINPIVGGDLPNNYVRVADTEFPPVQDSGACDTCHQFGSAHAASWNAVMADGSVRSLAYSMEPMNHRAFASTDGGDILENIE